MEKFRTNCEDEFVENKLKYSLHLIEKAMKFFDKIGFVYGLSINSEVILDILLDFFYKYKEKIILINVIPTQQENFKFQRKLVKIPFKQTQPDHVFIDTVREFALNEDISCFIVDNLLESSDIIYEESSGIPKIYPLLNWDPADIQNYVKSQKLL